MNFTTTLNIFSHKIFSRFCIFKIIIFMFVCSCEQKNTSKNANNTEFTKDTYNQLYSSKIFKIIEYHYGKPYRETYDTVNFTNEKLSIYFFSKHFHYPRSLPETLTSSQHKNKTISIWNKPESEKNYESNWNYTYTYDSLGRTVNYSYSSCMVCSNFAFYYILTYNLLGQITSIRNTLSEEDSYNIYYNKAGDIKELRIYSFGKLEKIIAAIN